MRTFALSTLALLAGAAGCNNPSPRLNAPVHGDSQDTVESQGTLVYMTDNALLANMSISDMHFLPHRAELSASGVERLARLSSLMQAYGGTVRFSTDSTDEALNSKRTQTIRDFLIDAGVHTTTEVVCMDLPGGDGLRATEAILIRADAATYKAGDADAKGAKSSTSGGSEGDKEQQK